jgi:NH3-dependent NAD+ synthetase
MPAQFLAAMIGALMDQAADVKPIAHLYKTQVYALAEHLPAADSC